jgi:nucleotide-binding universal stress UspA family protein
MDHLAMPSHPGDPSSPGGVVVGVDASLGVLSAVSWAAAEAARRHVSLHLVEVRPAAAGITEAHRSPTLRRARGVASAVAPGSAISATSFIGAVGPALRARARDAELLVVGSRRPTDPSTERDGTTRFLLARTDCPTAFVPARWAGSWASTPSARPVVAGLADTPDDHAVQELAARIARNLGVELIPVGPGADLIAALLDVGRCAQLIVLAGPAPLDHEARERRVAELEELLRRSPCAVVLPPRLGVSRRAAGGHGGAAAPSGVGRPVPTRR